MGKVFLHLGAHKTGTSFIQRNLRANDRYLRSQGWRYVKLQTDDVEAYRESKLLRRSDKPEDDAPHLMQFLRRVANARSNTFMSSEVLLGTMSVQKTGNIYPISGAMIERLHRGLRHHPDVQIAYCVRDYASFIVSSYNWLVTIGKNTSFDHYIRKVMPERLSWPRVIGGLVDAFGADRVHFWTYEDFQKAPLDYIRTMLQVAGVDASGFQPHTEERVNPSYPKGGLQIALRWNRFLAHNANLGNKERRQLMRDMRSLIARATPNNAPRTSLMSMALRAACEQQYQKDLATIRAKWPQIEMNLRKTALVNE